MKKSPDGNASRPSKKAGANGIDDLSSDMWIAPRSTLKGETGDRAWDRRYGTNPPSIARFLELGDVALGLKKPGPPRKGAAGMLPGASRQSVIKSEPYFKAAPTSAANAEGSGDPTHNGLIQPKEPRDATTKSDKQD